MQREGWTVTTRLAKGQKPPQWYSEQPEIGPLDEFYLSAFWDLSTTRGIGMTCGPIPWNHIRDYAEYAGLERDVGFAFAAIMRQLDAYYLSDMARQQELEADRARRRGGMTEGSSDG